MRAVRVRGFGEPEVMKVEEGVPLPEPAAGQVLVRVLASGVNPVDTYIRAGAYAALPELPYTPGKDGAGVVAGLGEGVSSLALGDRVYLMGNITGSLAEFCVCNEAQAVPLPDTYSFAEGAALGTPAYTAYRALHLRGGARPGEKLLVHGASGSVGLAAVSMAKAHGLWVLGTAGTAAGEAAVRAAGADEVLNHRSEGYMDAAVALTGGDGFDLCLEMLANVNLNADLGAMARRGRVCIIGNRGTVETNPRAIMARELDVRGVMLGVSSPADMAETRAHVAAMLRQGTLRVAVAREFPLEEAAEAHREVLAHSQGAQGRYVVTVAQG